MITEVANINPKLSISTIIYMLILSNFVLINIGKTFNYIYCLVSTLFSRFHNGHQLLCLRARYYVCSCTVQYGELNVSNWRCSTGYGLCQTGDTVRATDCAKLVIQYGLRIVLNRWIGCESGGACVWIRLACLGNVRFEWFYLFCNERRLLLEICFNH